MPKQNRNSKCACKSGLKFKHCCLKHKRVPATVWEKVPEQARKINNLIFNLKEGRRKEKNKTSCVYQPSS